MQVFLVRHAAAFEPDAAKWPDDRERPLTSEGAEEFRRAARGLLSLVTEVDVVLCSPLRRAWQTAEILQQGGWPAPLRFEPLEPGHAPADVVEALQPHAAVDSLALVGHEPGQHRLASYLLAGDPARVRLTFRTGSVACLTFDTDVRPGGAALDWLAAPRLLASSG